MIAQVPKLVLVPVPPVAAVAAVPPVPPVAALPKTITMTISETVQISCTRKSAVLTEKLHL